MLVKGQVFNVKITKANIDHYKSVGYNNISLRDVIQVRAEDLTKGSNKKVDVECDYCGKIIKVVYRDYLHYKFDKYSCASCRQKKTSEYNLTERQTYLYDNTLAVCNDKGYTLLTPKSEIKNSETRIKYMCPKHGVHETKIYTLMLGHGCIECGVEKNHEMSRKSPDEVYNDFKKNGGELLNKEDYKGWNYKNLKVICPLCKEVFVTSYNAFMHRDGQLCPKCASNISKHEYIIKQYLENKGISFEMFYRFDDCKSKIPLPFDFYLLDYNTTIEYDGEGHYIPIPRGGISKEEAEIKLKEIQERDRIKTNYCKNNNIQLIRIPYWDGDNIENILNEKLLFTQKI